MESATACQVIPSRGRIRQVAQLDVWRTTLHPEGFCSTQLGVIYSPTESRRRYQYKYSWPVTPPLHSTRRSWGVSRQIIPLTAAVSLSSRAPGASVTDRSTGMSAALDISSRSAASALDGGTSESRKIG